MHDAPAGEHSRRGDDHDRPVSMRDRLGLLDGIGELLARVLERRLTGAQELARLLVVVLRVVVVDLRGLRGHR